MKRLARIVIVLIFFILAQAGVHPVLADVATVSATVPEQNFNAPMLIAPANGSAINNPLPTFSWHRPDPIPDTPLNHYVLFIDGVEIANNLSDSLVMVDTYSYTATASAGVFYLTVKSNLTQGYHTWKVVAYNDSSISATSDTWSFYLDSNSPFISVTKVQNQTLTWNTSIPASLPSVSASYLTVTTANPTVTGGVEASANFQIILVCPTNIPTCTNQTYAANIPSGLWTYTFTGLVRGATYTVMASATDAGGNSTLFPDFYITYGAAVTVTSTPTPTPTDIASIIPTATPSASPSAFPTLPLGGPTLTPPPGLLAVITPTPFVNAPPSAPTPPPVKRQDQGGFLPTDLFYYFLLVLMILGLPLHLAMCLYSTETSFSFAPRFLYILAFPFFRAKDFRTIPFTSITIFIADKLNKPWQKVVSDIQGYFTLKTPIPESLYVILHSADRYWKDNLYKGTTIVNSCLYPLLVGSPNSHSRLLKTVYDYRIIPLVIACLTSITVMIIRPAYPVLIYAYFSLQYLFSEYLYPKISK